MIPSGIFIISGDSTSTIVIDPTNVDTGSYSICVSTLSDCGASPFCCYDLNLILCEEICDNGIDDNQNGLVDCDDPECGTNSSISVSPITSCPSDTVVFSGLDNGPDAEYFWNFGASASIDTISGIGPHGVVFNDCGIHPISLTVSRGNCISSDTLLYEIIDTEIPVWNNVPSDLFLECSSSINLTDSINQWLTNYGGATFTDNCSMSVVVTNNFTALADSCGPTGTALVTFFATDGCGNVAQTQANITYEDNNIPTATIPSDTIVYLDIACTVDTSSISTGTIVDAIDDCSGTLTITYTDDQSTLTGCNSTGTFARTWTVSDECGNQFIGIQNITILDTIQPTFTIPTDTTLFLNLFCLVDTSTISTGIPTNIDDVCSGSTSFSYVDDLTGLTGCNTSGSFVRTWTVSDECGNAATGIQTISIADTLAPTFTAPSDITLYLDNVCQVDTTTSVTGIPTGIADACGSNFTVNYSDDLTQLSLGCSNTGTLIRTWMVSDECGNINTEIQNITLLDTIAPTFTLPADTTLFTDNMCSVDTMTMSIGTPTNISDACSGTFTIDYNDDFSGLSGCNNTGTLLRTWTVSDECGNITTGIQSIGITDTLAPVFVLPVDTVLYLNSTCLVDTTTSSTGEPSGAVDACSASVITSYTDDLSNLNNCNSTGNLLRVWTVSDQCGNIATGVQIIAILDTLAPVFTLPADTTLYLNTLCDVDTSIISTGEPINIIDECSTGLSATYSDDLTNLTGCNNTGFILRTWTVSDDCGNLTAQTQSIAIVDTLGPVFVVPSDTTLYLDISCSIDTAATSTGTATSINDACSGSLVATYSDDFSTLNNCNNTGFISRTWLVTDDCGNTTTQNQIITVLDTLAPTFILPADTILYLDGTCSVDTNSISTGTPFGINDNCSSVINTIYTDDLSNLIGCNSTGTLIRTWSVEDECGNIATGIQNIEIVDTLAPIFTIPNDTILYLDLNCIVDTTTTSTGIPNDLLDACGGTVTSTYHDDLINLVSGCNSTGDLLRTWTITDECGNSATGIQTITVVDTIPPTFTVPADTLLYFDSNCQIDSTTNSIGIPTNIDDACTNTPIVTYIDNTTTLSGCNSTGTFTRIWTVTDACGNGFTQNQVVTVLDTLAPVFTIAQPADTTVQCSGIPAPPVIGTEIVAEKCGVSISIVLNETTQNATCLNTYELIRTWTATDDCGNQQIVTQTINVEDTTGPIITNCLLYTSPSPRDLSTSRMPSSA